MPDFISPPDDPSPAAVKGEHQGSGKVGVSGVCATGHGVHGESTTNHGVHGDSLSGRGVHGISKTFFGVSGASTDGIGVGGESTNGVGVFGRSPHSFGVQGVSDTNHGVHGDSTSGRGVQGISRTFFGVSGVSTDGIGVGGESTNGVGVFGKSPHSFGVHGVSDTNHGVHGDSVSGRGVQGISRTFFGVSGASTDGVGCAGESANGIGVLGKGGKLAGRFEGHVEITGNLDLTGPTSDIRLASADCAEDFDIAGATQVEPGTVMVLGVDGALVACRQDYDKRVAGVISGAGDYKPAIVLDTRKTPGNRQPIALMGKVFCKADARFGPIEVGDLLTTSPTSGHAMVAADPVKAFGCVIGKALRGLATGQGLIPILVTLQ